MQKLAPLAIAAGLLCPLALPANGLATAVCGPADAWPAARGAAAVEITIRTPEGQSAHGTGIVWDTAGHIVTNDHVAAAGDRHTVTLAGGETRAARVLARAPEQDLAVLAVEGPLPAPAPRRAAASLRTGEPVLALGNPFGRGMSVSGGTITGFGREVVTGPDRQLSGMIETTTPLSPGNSGGPLLTCRGEVVGINTAAVQPGQAGMQAGVRAGTRDGGARTGAIGFAIPIDRAGAVIGRLLRPADGAGSKGGAAERPGLGLYLAPGFRFPVVQGVVPGSPAALAGAMPGDTIIGANGRPVFSPADLQSLVREAGNGAVALLRIVRYGAPMDMAVRISPVAFSPS